MTDKDLLLRECRDILLAVAPLLGRLSKEQPELAVNPNLSSRCLTLSADIKKMLPKRGASDPGSEVLADRDTDTY